MPRAENTAPNSSKSRYLNLHYFSAVLACASWLLLLLIFYPGHFSPDSMSQYEQATGRTVLGDWHPPVMTLLWHLLITATGKVGSLLALQLAMLVFALFLLSIYIRKMGNSRLVSLLPYTLLIYPGIINIAGTIWKDVLMAHTLFLGSIVLLWAQHTVKGRRKTLLLTLAAILFIVGTTLRYNAIIAVAPLFLAITVLGTHKKMQRALIFVSLMFMGLIIPLVISNISGARKDYPMTAIMLDDILHVSTQSVSTGDTKLDNTMREISKTCSNWRLPMNSYIACTNSEQKYVLGHKHTTVQSLWLSSIMKNPVQYFQYRTHVFIFFLFPEKERFYIYQGGIVENPYGLKLKNPEMNDSVGYYIKGFAAVNVPFIFQAWFWLAVAMWLLWRIIVIRFKENVVIGSLLFSGILYNIGYFFIAVETDYRYIYWPACASLLSLIVFIAARHDFKAIRKTNFMRK